MRYFDLLPDSPEYARVEKFAADAIMDEWKLGVRHKIVWRTSYCSDRRSSSVSQRVTAGSQSRLAGSSNMGWRRPSAHIATLTTASDAIPGIARRNVARFIGGIRIKRNERNGGVPKRTREQNASSDVSMPRGHRPPFTTALVADSQRSSDPLLFITSARADSQRRWLPPSTFRDAMFEMRWMTLTTWF